MVIVLALAYLAVAVVASALLEQFELCDDEFLRGYAAAFWPVAALVIIFIGIVWFPFRGLAKLGHALPTLRRGR